MNPNKPMPFTARIVAFIMLPPLLFMMVSSFVIFSSTKNQVRTQEELSKFIEKLPKDEKFEPVRNQFEIMAMEMRQSEKTSMMIIMISNMVGIFIIVLAGFIGARYLQKKMAVQAGFDSDQLEVAKTAYMQLGDALNKIKPDDRQKNDADLHDF